MVSLWNFFAAISMGFGQGLIDILSAMQKACSGSHHMKHRTVAAHRGEGLMGQPKYPPSLTSSPSPWPSPPTYVHMPTLPAPHISNTYQEAAKLRVNIRLPPLSPPSEHPGQSLAGIVTSWSLVPTLESFPGPLCWSPNVHSLLPETPPVLDL